MVGGATVRDNLANVQRRAGCVKMICTKACWDFRYRWIFSRRYSPGALGADGSPGEMGVDLLTPWKKLPLLLYLSPPPIDRDPFTTCEKPRQGRSPSLQPRRCVSKR